jgi:hypothetical protein
VGLDATPAGQPLYRKHGFVENYSLVRMVTRPFGSPPGDPKGRVTHVDLSAILDMDREIFGANRSRLLVSLLARAPEFAWMITGRGYCFGRPGHRYHQLGPVVATDLDTARALVSHAVTQPCTIDVPLLDPAWVDWLKPAGFVEERSFTRMFLRGHVHPGDPSRQYAIAGPEFA